MNILIPFLLIFTSAQAFSNIKSLIKNIGLKPITESEDWKKNPNEWIYEECRLYIRYISKCDKELLEIERRHNYPGSVFCYSKREQTGFQIPVKISTNLSASAPAIV